MRQYCSQNNFYYTTLSDKVCQWLALGWRFSPGPPVVSINKTECHDITEILLKVALNTINLSYPTQLPRWGRKIKVVYKDFYFPITFHFNILIRHDFIIVTHPSGIFHNRFLLWAVYIVPFHLSTHFTLFLICLPN